MDNKPLLVHRTRGAVGFGWRRRWDHVVEREPRVCVHFGDRSNNLRAIRDLGRARARASGCGSSSSSPTAGRRRARVPALRDQVAAALAGARHTGWDGLLAEQRDLPRRVLDARRRRGRGRRRAPAGGALRALPRLQAGARAERRAIPAKGLTGTGYDGHAFWDTETFVLPVLTYTAPAAAADALRWRHSTLPLARERARRSSASRARRSRGGRSAARSARATGRRGPRHSTSTPTSPTR